MVVAALQTIVAALALEVSVPNAPFTTSPAARSPTARSLINGVALEADERETVYIQEFSTEPVEVSNRRLAALQGGRTSSTALTGTERAGFAQLRILDTGEMNAAGDPVTSRDIQLGPIEPCDAID